MELMRLKDAREDLLHAREMLRTSRLIQVDVNWATERYFAALDRVWAVQCMLNPSLS
jgi:hypothetical protein